MSSNSDKDVKDKLDAAGKALKAGRFFEAERLGLELLETSRAGSDFRSMAKVTPILKDARAMRMQAAIDTGGGIRFLEKIHEEGETVEPGCVLVEPPLVGAHARAIRLAALEQEVPLAILCREPITQMNLRPIVTIGRITIRTQVPRDKKEDEPSMDWFLGALDELGECAIESLDTGADILKQIDGLLDRLDAHPDHARLHDALEETCMLAAEQCAESS